MQLVACIARLGAIIVFAVSLIGYSGKTWACTLCINFPAKTDVDFLANSDCVILARPSAKSPFTYSCVETLKGVFDRSDIDLLVDSLTRRVLAANPERTVLLVQEEAGGNWRSMGVVSESYLPVVRRVVLVASDWKGKEGVRRRWQFFVPLFGHDDPRIRQLAYLELGRAPYVTLRRLGRSVSRDTYASVLADPKYLKWRSLAILLLAQSEDPLDRQLIRESLASAERLGITTNLAAWAAAAIEVDGATAIDFIDSQYSSRANRTSKEIEAILSAFSMHGGIADNGMRDRVVESYRLLLQTHPRVAVKVAQDLSSWNRYDLNDEIAESLTESTTLSIEEQQSIRRYLRAVATQEDLVLGPN